jgi:hypothetical protein
MRSSHSACTRLDHAAWLAALLWLPLAASAQPRLEQQLTAPEPMACAAYAAMRAADYPEAVRVYEERLPPRSYEEADLAALGLLWRHRADFAAAVAEPSVPGLSSPPPPPDGQTDGRIGRDQRLEGSLAAQRQAIADSCQPLYDEADRSCPSVIGFQPAR